jgi:glycosyltransferase involved in cell wall biosynthesis
MKIVNVCVSNPYIEGFSYQENLLTDYFVYANIETSIITVNKFPFNFKLKSVKSGIYFERGKKIIRLSCLMISNEFVFPYGLYRQLVKEQPNVIFHHNLNCTSLIICTIYKIFNPEVVLLVDNHADYINRKANKFWNFLYSKILVRYSAKFASKFVRKFYGVTPYRCDYLQQLYGINYSKIDLLPIGTDVISADKIFETKDELRKLNNISSDIFIFVSGGKMGIDKGTDKLIKVIDDLAIINPKVLLILFGSFQDVYTEKLAEESKSVKFIGWCDHSTTLRILKLSDIAIWPKHHTTLIEDAISVKTPLIIRKTRNTEHLIDGNGIFLLDDSYDELSCKINIAINESVKLDFNRGCDKVREKLSYKVIVNKVLNDIQIKKS